ncbi:sensor domain-containing diguanylate cyclase [Sedimenticola selenatireducens]|uniref:Diguanylate cyclase n=1 Tax=Sedimenticola selenatireducens TaxID=191960 RepID=A0A558DPU5_9GAMM|nr:diguanylate cyclase [Sedimenticola selenatireducens]TVO70453.1 diguanylate cyclase [Sedimenticola selenatireducens]TVT63030.1 MAG: diguanylate cyclase [Sedimenticola selenatireducens]
MDHLNHAHQLLAAPAETDKEFFEHAAQAIAVASQSRWGGVGFCEPECDDVDVVALWDGDGLGHAFAFSMHGSPCEQFYAEHVDTLHIHYEDNIREHFANSDLIDLLKGDSYRAHAIFGDQERIIGHIFALDDKPQHDQVELRTFFELLSQRISTECKRYQHQKSLQRYAKMVSITRNMLSFVDNSFTYHAVSQGYVDTFGQPHEQLIGKQAKDLHGEDAFNNVLKPLLKRTFNGESVNSQIWIHPPNNTPKYLDLIQTPYYEPDGTISGVVVSGHDITAQKKTEETLQKLSLAVTHSPVLTVITDPDGVIEYVSPIVEKITGYTAEEVIGNTPRLFKSGRTDIAVYESLWQAIKNKQSWQGEIENRRKDGRCYWEHISIAPVLNDNNELIAFVGSSTDITERKHLEQKLQELASTDPLTGIYNRRHFLAEIETHLEYSKRYKSPLSLLIIDIDNFKSINDEGGHALGDAVIQQFTQVCEQTIRNVDLLGRLGGDEFAILMPETDRNEALVLAERIKEEVSQFELQYESHTLHITVSIGLSTFRKDPIQDDTVESLMARADEGLYQAKRGGRNLIGVI